MYARQAVKDAIKLAATGLKPKAQKPLTVLANDPFQNPPPFEKLAIYPALFAPHQYSASPRVRGIAKEKTVRVLRDVDALRVTGREYVSQ